MTVKIKDVAKAANVSIATVSYVLNDSAPVSDETRARVLEAIRKLNYRPNSTARNLKANETRLMGYAWHTTEPGQMNAILDRFVYQTARSAEAHGYHILTFATAPHDPSQAFDELVRTSRVDGFILAETDNPRLLRHLLALNFPFVAFGRADSEWDFLYVDVDVHAGIRMAVQHLLTLGHQRIGCIAWPSTSHNGEIRLAGYMDTMRAAGIEPCAEWVVRVRNTIDDGFRATNRLLHMPEANRPTALVSLSDVMALGAMSCIEALGLRIGSDVAVTGFDDDPMSAYLHPALTTLHQPIDLIANRVIEMLVAAIAGQPIAERHVLVEPELMVRTSSDPSLPPSHPVLLSHDDPENAEEPNHTA